MTPDEIRAKEPGPELDAEVAKALGWELCWHREHSVWLDQDGWPRDILWWSTNPEHAVRLLVEAERRGWEVTIGIARGDDVWEVEMTSTRYVIVAGTLPGAISKAFLLASMETEP